ncbi:hypothetical protein M0R45_021214 [Rubus argutus]|uniref:Endonuclease/exonuclease/phosphatase domain-containing protein n=1 Tax=Rubus argutus TaxID=59490 RepID=A0AAW1XCC8_RUBAR
MRILSWNVRGLGSKKKRSVIKTLLTGSGADVVILQETKKTEIERRLIQSIWGGRYNDWVSIPAWGRSGGVVVIWNTKCVSVVESVIGAFSVSIKIKGLDGNDWWLSGVYGPNSFRERKLFWEELAGLYGLCGRRWCLGGDFNVVRFVSEKSNGGRTTRSMQDFNDFIRETSLCDPNLHGAEFTWSNLRENVIWCRLDRFLFSTDWEALFPNTRQLALTRVTSDHCPILLDTICVKWGPTPFKFENMWLEHPSFKENFRNWWMTSDSSSWEGFSFMRKLKSLKLELKTWSKETFGEVGKEKKEIEATINKLDEEDRDEGLCFAKRRERENLRIRLEELVFREEIYWSQRAKPKWAREGDSNTSFFHKIVNGRRKRNFIERIELSSGLVVEEEALIQEEIINFYKKLYSN